MPAEVPAPAAAGGPREPYAGAAKGPSGSAPSAVAVSGLVRRFGEREALSGVGFELEHGETLVVLGPNGAGKTTLLRVLATLLMPHGGEVRVLGCALPRQAEALRSRIGLLAHEPLLYRDLTGRENLTFYARLYDLPRPEPRIAELLEAVGMQRRADEPLRSLSRGMVQRLAVCRAVLHGPDLLLLDEPWSHLDPEADALVDGLVGRSSGRTRVLVTHDVERGLAEADRVLALRSGRVALIAGAASMDPEELRPVYGGAR